MTDGRERYKYDVCVVGGAGHVGLPLGVAFAHEGLRVLLHDINEASLESIQGGEMLFMEEGGEAMLREALGSGRLFTSPDPSEAGNAANVILTIGTPVDEFLNPVIKVIKGCIDALLEHLSPDQLLVLRSTVYPGTTDWLASYLESRSKPMRIAFCPERVVQGFAIKEMRQFPQIVSGTTPEAEATATELFALVAPEVIALSPLEAEFAKLFTNAYRYIHFAVTNQFYMIANSAEVDYGRILQALKLNYPRADYLPTAGLTAGPCLLKDTMQLSAFANNQFQLGHSAMLVNEGLVLYLVSRMAQTHDLGAMVIGLLGMAFKADNDDTRSSLSYKLKKELAFRAKAVLTTDPHVLTDPELVSLDEAVAQSDLLVLCVPHTAYQGLDLGDKPVVDIWDFFGNGTRV